MDWHTVEAMDRYHMAEQLKRAGMHGPKAIGIDEISIRKGHTYRIVVSELPHLLEESIAPDILAFGGVFGTGENALSYLIGHQRLVG